MRPAELFCSIDRTSFVAVSATVFAIFVFALMLTSGLPKFGPSDLPKVNYPIMAPDADRETPSFLWLCTTAGFSGEKIQSRFMTCDMKSVTVSNEILKPRYS